MKKYLLNLSFIWLLGISVPTFAHFQLLLPTTDIVSVNDNKIIQLTAIFTHPMQQKPVMEMGTPQQFGVLVNGKQEDLRHTLQTQQQDGKTFFTANYSLTLPTDYVFFLVPAPYWEPAEGKMIIHYTKVVVDAFGAETGWDQLVGLPVEIEPLVRPYGLWTGNLFRGVVKQNGEPVPNAEIEVEYWNQNQSVTIPADPFITQVIKADKHGIFAYAMPKAGWWGFAALIDTTELLTNPAGKKVPVELGGLIWVKTVDMD
jgi:cobalt/nickel transport protein